MAEYSHDGGHILAYTVASAGKVLLLSSNNSIVYLNREMKQNKTIPVSDEYILTGTICVSSEGLVFVGMHDRKDKQRTLVRIYSAVGGDYFDIKEKVNVMEISTDDKYLITNTAASILVIVGVLAITSLRWMMYRRQKTVAKLPTVKQSFWCQTRMLSPKMICLKICRRESMKWRS